MGKPHAAMFALEQPVDIEPRQSTFDHARLPIAIRAASNRPLARRGHRRDRSVRAGGAAGYGAEHPGRRCSRTHRRAESRSFESYYRDNVSPRIKELKDQLAAQRKSRDALDKAIPTSMVMQEMDKPRDTFMLVRGQYDKRGERSPRACPSSCRPCRPGAPANRLGLARWLVDPAHPLVARVAVNRYWQMFFGTGLVKTAEDFGSQGELPSHPELLDWLAVEFREPSQGTSGNGSTAAWDVKALVRLIVTSATYRQASIVTPELLARDPENRLLGSGAADAAAGGIHPRPGPGRERAAGRQDRRGQRLALPAGRLWEELAFRADGKNWTAQTYTQSHGADLYRRTMYTFWKRTSPPPTLVTFDAPDRETCTVRRSTTNTPLQALVLLNDPTYVEASRKLAERIMTEAPTTTDERIAFAFRLATARRPRPLRRQCCVECSSRNWPCIGATPPRRRSCWLWAKALGTKSWMPPSWPPGRRWPA